MMRTMVSEPLPGENGTTKRIGLEGQIARAPPLQTTEKERAPRLQRRGRICDDTRHLLQDAVLGPS
jgi:hypothetical protein